MIKKLVGEVHWKAGKKPGLRGKRQEMRGAGLRYEMWPKQKARLQSCC